MLALLSSTTPIKRGDQMTHSVRSTGYTPSPALSRTAITGFVIALTAAGIAMLASLGSRWDLWHYSISLLMLRIATLCGILSFAVCLAGAVITMPGSWRGGFRCAVFGLAISFIIVAVPLSWQAATAEAPLIHDITTDVADPPKFMALLPLRATAPNSADYGGPEVAALQHAAYPDIQPVTLYMTPDRALDQAMAAARSLGWTIMQRDRQEGRIEALERTTWFGFTDDIVIRVRPESNGSRVDIRSVSRVGAGDTGTNAARVRK